MISILAPMDDVTETCFRGVVSSCAAPDLTMTEFVNVDGLCSPGRPRLQPKLWTDKDITPVIAQIWGKNPDNFETIAREIADSGRFAGVDINMGCPVKNVVSNGTCSALIDHRDLAVAMIKAVQKGLDGRLPMSVKCRLGRATIDYTWHELLLSQDLDMLTIHARTVKEMSKVPAHWQDLSPIVALRDKIAPQTKLIGNGDVANATQGIELCRQYELDGYMIGRGVFADPYCFAPESKWSTETREQRILLYLQHVRSFAETYQNREKGFPTLKKFAKVYISDFDMASELRDQCYQCNEPGELMDILEKAIL
jgi:tRNA-dihydrouridine synthase